MNVFIVDDEKNSREVIKELISNFCEGVNIVGEAESVDKAYKLISLCKPDLVLLDIQMPTGNGFNLLKKYSELPFEVIFITSHEQYAINAIKYSALDYILKPINTELLKESIKNAREKINKKSSSQVQIINLFDNLNEAVTEKRIVVHESEEVKLIKLSQIVLLEGDINYTHIITSTKEKYVSSKNLKEFEEMLCNYGNFVRAHRKYIINTEYIESYTKGDPFYIKLSNGMKIEASRRKKQDVLNRLRNKQI